jgi:hypothetical protein
MHSMRNSSDLYRSGSSSIEGAGACCTCAHMLNPFTPLRCAAAASSMCCFLYRQPLDSPEKEPPKPVGGTLSLRPGRPMQDLPWLETHRPIQIGQLNRLETYNDVHPHQCGPSWA